MKFLHTADWHIGQLFYNYERSHEHEAFLKWLENTLNQEQIDVLLISGDVFDNANPSAASIRLFYSFLNNATRANPALHIIITAGNHDSASRLEIPRPLLESSNIHIAGVVERDEHGNILYDKLMIPVNDTSGTTQAWVMAVPFLRAGDIDHLPGSVHPYSEGVETFYQNMYEKVKSLHQPGQALIAMGHMHTIRALSSPDDEIERPIMGGVECISTHAFNMAINYVALGHIHLAQQIGDTGNIYYCGSPVPMSFSEVRYTHGVNLFEWRNNEIISIRRLNVPLFTALITIPARHAPLPDVLNEIINYPAYAGENISSPFLEVRVKLDQPEPGLRYKVEEALQGKNLKLARICVKYPEKEKENKTALLNIDKLGRLNPRDIFISVYKERFNADVPDRIMQLFDQSVNELNLEEK